VLTQSAWANRLTEDDRRGLTPLIWNHINPYGVFRLNMSARLVIEHPEPAARR
jgi:hypothetical protein